MEIKRMEGVELTLVNQNSPKNESKKCKHGVMEQRGCKRYVFTEEIPRHRPQPNPRVYDGHYLSMTCNKRGQHMVYVTGELLGIDNTPTEEQVSNMKALCEKVLEPQRNRLGHAVRITSGFRCKFLNKAVKGAENSLHMQGLAADLYVRGVADAIKVVYLIIDGGEYGQVILERGARGKIWVHVSYLKNNGSRHQVFIN